MGFDRHKTTKKCQKSWAAQIVSGCPWPQAFSVDQGYSLTGCSPAEPVSAYPDNLNIIPTFDFQQKSYQHTLGFR